MNRNPDGVTYVRTHPGEYDVVCIGTHPQVVGTVKRDNVIRMNDLSMHVMWEARDERGKYIDHFNSRHRAATIIRNRWVAETRES